MAEVGELALDARGSDRIAELPVLRQGQVAALRAHLAARGIEDDDPRMDLFLAPLLRGVRETRAGTRADPHGDDRNPRNVVRPAVSARRAALGWAITPLALALARDTVPGGGPLPDRPMAQDAIDAAIAAARDYKSIAQYLLDWPILLAIAALLGAIGAIVLLWPRLRALIDRRRRERLLRGELPDRGPLVEVATRAGHARLFADADLAGPLGRLRRHRAVPSRAIDVRASIRATLRSGSGPVVRWARRRLSPDYVLLSERERAHDHLAEVAGAWHRRMIDARIPCEHYEFFGAPDPAHLRGGRDDGRAQPLETILARHGDGHVLVMLESFDIAIEDGGAPDWLVEAQRGTRVHQLNPREPRQWDQLEAQLRTLGLPPFAATAAGFAELAEQVGQAIDGDGPAVEAGAGTAAPDLAAFLAEHREMLLSNDEPPGEPGERIAQVVDLLERWLDRESYLWLRALALFPTINTGFTFFAGCVLEDTPLLTHRRFLALARLPWLRAATMPRWLRIALAETLSRDQLKRAAATVAAFLDPPLGAPADETQLIELRRAAEDPQRLRRLAARLTHTPNAFRDRLLFAALEGRSPRELRAAVDGSSEPAPRPWWRSGRLYAVLAALLSTGLLLTFQPAGLRDYWGLWKLDPRRGDPLPTQPTPSPSPPPTAEPTAEPSASPSDVPTAQIEQTAVSPSPVPTPKPTPSDTSIRVYIQYSDASQLGRARAAQAALAGAVIDGLPVLVPQFDNKGQNTPDVSQLRCFDDGGCNAAPQVAERLAKAGIAASIIRWPGGIGNARANHLELWFERKSGSAASGSYQIVFEASDSFTLSALDRRNLQALAKSLSRSRNSAVSVGCYTNVTGNSDAYADSQDMADAVAKYLETLGIPGKNISATGWSNPSYDDMDPLPRDERKLEDQLRYCDVEVRSSFGEETKN